MARNSKTAMQRNNRGKKAENKFFCLCVNHCIISGDVLGYEKES